MGAGTVLIVEDEQEARELLAELLEFEGFKVAAAANGAALAYLQTSGKPCLIILDLMMPVMDGREFRSKQLKDPWLAQIPVVLIGRVRRNRAGLYRGSEGMKFRFTMFNDCSIGGMASDGVDLYRVSDRGWKPR